PDLLRVVDGTYRDRDRLPADDQVKPLSLLDGQLLRVVEPGHADPDRQHHRAAHHGSRQRAHAHLVHAGDHLVAHRQRHALVAPQHGPHLGNLIESRLATTGTGIKKSLTNCVITLTRPGAHGAYDSASSLSSVSAVSVSSPSAASGSAPSAERRSRMRAPLPTLPRR